MHRQSPVFADCSPYVFNILCLLRAFQSVDHFQQILNHLWSIRATLLFVLHSLHFPESHLNHQSSFWGGMFQLNEKFDADSLLYSLSHFECNSHTVHMLTQQRLPTPWTSTVKFSLFMHEQWQVHCTSGGGRHPSVSMCTVWLLHSKWLSK